MAIPTELSLEAVRNYMLEHGGKITNHDLVKHFKIFLTNPETRVEARNEFKEYVNILATIRNYEGEKYLVLKSKFRPPSDAPGSSGEVASPPQSPGAVYMSTESLTSPSRPPPPYRAPPPPAASPTASPVGHSSSGTPPVPPRRKSSDKIKLDNKENVEHVKRPKTIGAENSAKQEQEETEQISVKERTQAFNRLASEGDLLRSHLPSKKKIDRGGGDDEDAVSVTSDPKAREWLVLAAQGDHMKLTKLARENSRLAAYKDPNSGYTALHWAAKHGNSEMVKLIAGTYNVDVNVRSNGGYTPLHLATQFGHEEIIQLLVNGYGADQNIRDYSGKKPRQYQTTNSKDSSVSADTYRKIKARKKHAEKDLGFLRIGSLNVRVKRTTEAFSNFLGVGTNSEKIHKTWGSADNIQQSDHNLMPPPKVAPIKKRRSRRALDYAGSQSVPSTPPSHIRNSNPEPTGDSDSDNACGFDSNWQSTV